MWRADPFGIQLLRSAPASAVGLPCPCVLAMEREVNVKHWYAVHCKPLQDARAEQHLRNQGYEVFRPKLRERRRGASGVRVVTGSLFPRYLFVQLDNLHQDWGPIRSTRGVAGLVRMGGTAPPLPDSLVQEIRSRLDTDDCLHPRPDSPYRQNEKLRIVEGPFSGLEGLFQTRSGEERVVLLLNVMQRTTRITAPEPAVARA